MRRATPTERWPRPTIVGILNVTPDSFSDGGAYATARAAADGARAMLDAGAAFVDVGGESTRPGAAAVTVDEELRRVVPVLEELAGRPISVDTSRAEVARRAIALGARMVNDVTALRRDPELAGVVADAGVEVCLMHMQGQPRTMQAAPQYDDVVSEVVAFLEERLVFAVAEGVAEERICLDPGFGFGKTPDQNLELARRLDRIVAIGRPVLVGLSRKSTLARIVPGREERVGTDAASVGAAVAAFDRGATLFRVHDVRAHVEALEAAAAVERGTVTP
jgi:dihydropteroate synthase